MVVMHAWDCGTPEQFAAMIRTELARVAKIVKVAGIKAE